MQGGASKESTAIVNINLNIWYESWESKIFVRIVYLIEYETRLSDSHI